MGPHANCGENCAACLPNHMHQGTVLEDHVRRLALQAVAHADDTHIAESQ